MNLNSLDLQRGEIEARHPGWHVWYIPRAVGGTIWCAQRRPTLNEASPRDLEKAIAEAEEEHPSR